MRITAEWFWNIHHMMSFKIVATIITFAFYLIYCIIVQFMNRHNPFSGWLIIYHLDVKINDIIRLATFTPVIHKLRTKIIGNVI